MSGDNTCFSEMQKMIGQTVLVSDGSGVKYQAKIKDAKTAYGQVRYLVEPVAGVGSKWVMTFTPMEKLFGRIIGMAIKEGA